MKMLPEHLDEMQRLNGQAPAARRVVHVVGRMTESIFGFLGPATKALARKGLRQTLILLDEPRHRHQLSRFDRSVELLPVPVDGGPAARWMRVVAGYRAALQDGPVFAVHLHGAIPYFFCAFLRAPGGVQPVVLFSPHGSRVLASLPLRNGALMRVAAPLVTHGRRQTLTGARHETRWLSRFSNGAVGVLENPVDTQLLEQPREESALPLVAAASCFEDRVGAAVVARLAVLLANDESGIRFEWFGPLDGSREQLSAAGVDLIGPLPASERTHRLSAAWIYVAAGTDRGFPYRLAEAMALGLPCVAIDCTASRDLLRDGETGFLYETAEAALLHVAQLLDSPELRARIGEAARLDARTRFHAERFDQGLFDLYSLDATDHLGVPQY